MSYDANGSPVPSDKMLLGLIGFAGSGKGAVGDVLVKDYAFVTDSFAKSVKDAVSVIFNWPRELLEGDTEGSRRFRETPDVYWTEALRGPLNDNNWSFTPRMALQLMGTEAGRNVFGPNLWTASLMNRIKWTMDYENIVITDVRFPNEIDAVKKAGGHVVRVKRGPDPDWMKKVEDLVAKGVKPFYPKHERDSTYDDRYSINEWLLENVGVVHYSEWAWIGHGYIPIISNDGTLEDLKGNVNAHLMWINANQWGNHGV